MLTEKQKRFVAEYLIDLNAKAAYIRAGYKAEGHAAESAASRLLRNDEISAAIQAASKKVQENLGIDAEYVLSTIKATIQRCLQAEPVMIRGQDGEMVESGEYKFESSSVLKGCELLGKHLKMFTDKVEHTGKDGKDLIPETDDMTLARRVAFVLTKATIDKAKETANAQG